MKLNLNTLPKEKMGDLQTAGGNRPNAGRGMVRIKEFNEFGGVNSGHQIVLEIVSWTDDESVGRVHKETIFQHEPSKSDVDYCTLKILLLLQVTGLITPAESAAAQEGGIELDVNPKELEGRVCFCTLSSRQDKNDKSKTYINVANMGQAYYHLLDSRCEGWPVNQGVLNRETARIGKWDVPDQPAEQSSNSSPAVFGKV